MSCVPGDIPCVSCPYRRDVPAGIWAWTEYVKLPEYDLPLHEQPPAAFFCHQRDGKLCAGWVGCHDMTENLGLRLLASMERLEPAEVHAIIDYTTSVPLFASGTEACQHGVAGIEDPGEQAQKIIAKLSKRPEMRQA